MGTKGEARKLLITETALDLFHAKGILSVSLSEVAQAARTSQSALYIYFKNIEELMTHGCLVAVTRGREFIDAQVGSGDRAEARMRAYIDANLLWCARFPRDTSAVLATYYLGLTSPGLARLHALVDSQSIERLSVFVLQVFYESGRAPDPAQARLTARHIHDLVVGEMIKALRAPKELTVKKRAEQIWSSVRKLLA